MGIERGSVVISLKGRDRGLTMCVQNVTDKGVLVCDGKERRLQKPKLKNPKHIRALESKLSEEQMLSDKSLRKALKLIPEALLCQNRI